MLCNNKTNARVVSSCKSSIMDSYLFVSTHTPNQIAKKSSISHKRTELKPNKQVVKLLVHLPNG